MIGFTVRDGHVVAGIKGGGGRSGCGTSAKCLCTSMWSYVYNDAKPMMCHVFGERVGAVRGMRREWGL